MCNVFQRHSKYKDWASDARRAAKMVFRALGHVGSVEQSFALLLLSGQYLSVTIPAKLHLLFSFLFFAPRIGTNPWDA